MNYFLTLIIMGLCAAGYYEYTDLQQKSATDLQELNELTAKITTFQTENQQLEDDNAKLKKSVIDTQVQIADLTTQIQAAQSELADAKQQVVQAQKASTMAAATASTTAPPPPPSTNDLGTIVTQDGKTFQNCQLLKVEADGVVVNHSAGITKIMYSLLPPELQKRFGYDLKQGPDLTDTQVRILEQLRQAAGN